MRYYWYAEGSKLLLVTHRITMFIILSLISLLSIRWLVSLYLYLSFLQGLLISLCPPFSHTWFLSPAVLVEKKFVTWRKFSIWQRNVLCCFVAKSVLSQFTLFCREICFVAIYSLFVWRKIEPKIVLVEKKRQISGMTFPDP